MDEIKNFVLSRELADQNLYEVIEKRHSRRKYHDIPLESEELSALQGDISSLESRLDLTRIVLRREGFNRAVKTIIGSYGLVTGAASFATLIAKEEKNEFRANVEAGVLGEALILAAAVRGWDTCWVGGMLSRGEIRKELELEAKEEVLAITPLGKAKDGLTLTERLAKKIVGSRSRKPLEELVENYQPEKYPDWIKTALRAARLAPSAANKQPWRFQVDPDAEKIKLLSESQQDRHGVSPFLDCGIALLHLMLGAAQKLEKPAFNLLKPPEVAEVLPE
ncbi:nitroreductase family protein [Halarsenatibacter silvermanii]|uniref:Nitroreductase family protein n=1 Tax=Halarsenatibacter silvermanii TaxID=321763 RepID=A0A1G9GVC4_9FIRM|nr:nitroreductase family protein [Halarsenatibacter silvermanii]SDL04639.1 Nitroreductase family protein [Halarsenatibacter silvermanii]